MNDLSTVEGMPSIPEEVGKVEMLSSLEIARLTDKQHPHVLRDIRDMLKGLYSKNPNLDHSTIQGITEVKDALGRMGKILLDKRHCLLSTVEGMPALIEQDGKPMADSRQIAEHFEKQHKNVLADIRNLSSECMGDGLNFQPVPVFLASKYKDAKGELRPFFLLDRDAFSLLVMGFTGSEAIQWKLRYIQAFNAMEKKLLPTDYLSALKALVASEEAKQLAETKAIEYHKEAKQKTEEIKNAFMEAGDFTLRDAAKQFGLAPVKEFIPWLFEQKYCYKDQETGRCLPYQDHVQSGMFAIRLAIINGAPRKAVVITSQGMLKLNEIITNIKRELF